MLPYSVQAALGRVISYHYCMYLSNGRVPILPVVYAKIQLEARLTSACIPSFAVGADVQYLRQCSRCQATYCYKKGQTTESGIPPVYNDRKRYTRIHLGFTGQGSTLIGRIGIVSVVDTCAYLCYRLSAVGKQKLTGLPAYFSVWCVGARCSVRQRLSYARVHARASAPMRACMRMGYVRMFPIDREGLSVQRA